jgi:hypothetical protein
MEIMQGPIEVTLGILFGVCYGLLMIYLPHRKDVSLMQMRSATLETKIKYIFRLTLLSGEQFCS